MTQTIRFPGGTIHRIAGITKRTARPIIRTLVRTPPRRLGLIALLSLYLH